jgi:hypothetical protein
MTSDDIGKIGESWCFIALSDLCGRAEPYFRPRGLDGEYPTFDFIVDLVDCPGCFFFVQVKATRDGFTTGPPPRLNVRVSQQDIDRIVACPAPTYVVGIDAAGGGTAFLLSVNEARDHFASLTTQFRIDCSVLEALRDEVRDYWMTRDTVLRGSQFSE